MNLEKGSADSRQQGACVKRVKGARALIHRRDEGIGDRDHTSRPDHEQPQNANVLLCIALFLCACVFVFIVYRQAVPSELLLVVLQFVVLQDPQHHERVSFVVALVVVVFAALQPSEQPQCGRLLLLSFALGLFH